MENTYFAPGCALYIYKEHLADNLLDYLNKEFDIPKEYHLTCCHHDPKKPNGTKLINVCSGCGRRFSSLYDGISTVSLWEVLADSNFPFPDYKGAKIAVQDSCPTRNNENVHKSIRTLLKRMNFEILEPEFTGTNQRCCGDYLYPHKSSEEIIAGQKKRADEMPCDDVCVYCVSCIKSFSNGGKTPRYIVDLLFNEQTEPGETEPYKWHKEVNDFIEAH